MNKKILAVGLIVILAVSIGFVTVTYFQEKTKHQANTYTVEGTLCLASDDFFVPCISATTITPSVSPWPGNISIIADWGPPGILNETIGTVSSAIFLTFSHSVPKSSFPVSFEQGDTVKISGQMTYNATYNAYYMTVTSITHIAS